MWQIYEMKVIILSRGGLIFWKYLRGNPRRYEKAISNSRVKYQKLAEVIVIIEIL